MPFENLYTRINAELKFRLDQFCAEKRVSIREVVETSLKNYLEKEEEKMQRYTLCDLAIIAFDDDSEITPIRAWVDGEAHDDYIYASPGDVVMLEYDDGINTKRIEIEIP